MVRGTATGSSPRGPWAAPSGVVASIVAAPKIRISFLCINFAPLPRRFPEWICFSNSLHGVGLRGPERSGSTMGRKAGSIRPWGHALNKRECEFIERLASENPAGASLEPADQSLTDPNCYRFFDRFFPHADFWRLLSQ